MNFSYDMNNVADYNLSFIFDSGKVQWYLDDIKKSKDFINQHLKSQLPKKKIFKINSLTYNKESQVKDINFSFDCSYNDENNTLSIIVNENINNTNLIKEIALILFLFVQKVNIDKLFLVVALKNPNYILLLLEMLALEFKCEKSIKSTYINGNAYKILYVETKDISNSIEEFSF